MIQRGDYIVSDLATGWVMARVRSNGTPCVTVLDCDGVVHLVPEMRATPAASPAVRQRVRLVCKDGVLL